MRHNASQQALGGGDPRGAETRSAAQRPRTVRLRLIVKHAPPDPTICKSDDCINATAELPHARLAARYPSCGFSSTLPVPPQ